MNGVANKEQPSSKVFDDQDDEQTIKFMDWGFNIDRLFEVAHRFYKRNESKAFHPSFDIRNQMNALILQARYGDHDSGRAPDIGVLDFVGKRRQYEWTLLKGMSKTEAMSKFICTLDELCPFFKAHAEAVKISSCSDQSTDNNYHSVNHHVGQNGNSAGQSSDAKEQLKTIYSSLCRQTHNQFKGYAEKQYPNDVVQQKHLIKSLQEQYFQQYVSQMHPELKDSQITRYQDGDTQQVNNCSNIPSSNPSPSVSEKSQPNTTPDLNGGDTRTSMSSNVHQVDAVEKTAPKLVTPFQSVDLNTNSTTLGDISVDNFVPMPHPFAGKQSEVCESKIIEADISCEELNTSDVPSAKKDMSYELQYKGENQPNTADLHIVAPPPIETKSPTTANLSPDSIASNQQPPPQSNHIEHVRLYQNIDPPPIGPFESFPEPKPIQSISQTPSTPIGDLNPNLKSTKLDTDLVGFSQSIKAPNSNVSNENLQQQMVGSIVSSVAITNHTSSIVQSPFSPTTTDLSSYHEFHQHQLPNAPTLSLTDASVTSASANTGLEATTDGLPSQDDYPQLAAHSEDPVEFSESNDGICPCTIPVEHSTLDNNQPEPWGCASSESDHCGSPVDIIDQQQQRGLYELAATWSKKGVAEFKDSLGNDKYGGVYEVKEGTMVVIQVPTYPDGRFIYWEFATDDYDIAFGLDFVYETNLIQPLAINIYEESDEDDEIIQDLANPNYVSPDCSVKCTSAQAGYHLDIEAANYGLDQVHEPPNVSPMRGALSAKARRLANTISIVPTYRRDSHEEVFVGRHMYPAKGYYLLKFDNTYSVLRSKTLYFRICYLI